MTVPGKGGRPRKWRTDADRVRAYRARQRGEPEPPELAVAVADGDELALALEEIRRLRAELAEQQDVERSLRRKLASLRRAQNSDAVRVEWLNADLDRLRKNQTEAEAAWHQAEALAAKLRDENDLLRQRLRSVPALEKPADSSPAASRSQRRRSARAARRQAR